nr:hypothetical protein [Tanacetum cinerariifolium]
METKTKTTTTITITIHPPPSQPQQSTTDSVLMKRIGKLKHIMANLIQENKHLEERIWETNSYKTHEDHIMLYEALEKSMNRDHSEELAKDLDKARKKKKKRRPSGASGSPKAFGSSQVPPPPHPPLSTNQEDLHMDEDMAPDAQAQSSDDEDIRNAHIPKVNLRQDWWKPLEEEKPTTPKPAWSIPSSGVFVPNNNWASALASTYSPPLKDSLLA